jgi:hypothetical protein
MTTRFATAGATSLSLPFVLNTPGGSQATLTQEYEPGGRTFLANVKRIQGTGRIVALTRTSSGRALKEEDRHSLTTDHVDFASAFSSAALRRM